MNNSTNKIKVGVIFGGRSGEHEVSLVSAQSVIKTLDRNKYDVIPIGISKQGLWLTGNDAMKYLKTGQGENISQNFISPEPDTKEIVKVLNNKPKTIQKLLDVVFPLLHGPYGEDGAIQGLFELSDLPYVGAGVLASACGMDKAIMKALFEKAGLPIGNYISFTHHEWSKNISFYQNEIKEKIKFPLFTKPANLGSSVGIMKCHDESELKSGVEEAFKFDRKVVIEENIVGREIECSVLGNNEPKASLPGEVKPKREFYDYEAKYVTGDSDLIIPAKLTDQEVSEIQKLAIKTFKSIDCSGLARVDFFIKEDGQIVVNEINTMPGFTSISMYPKLWEVSGLPYASLLDELIELALERHEEKKKLNSSIKLDNDWYNKS